MDKRLVCYTETLGSLYAGQGYYHKAAEIFRYLLEKGPESPSISNRLADAERKMGLEMVNENGDVSGGLNTLIADWARLLIACHRAERLDQVAKRIQSFKIDAEYIETL